MKNLYSPELAKNYYDAIIIGSGMGGLTTAAILSKAGKKVLVLEKHYVAGGFTHTFKRKKFEWDVGVHYVGQVNIKDGLLRKAFDYVTDGKLKWSDMGKVYDQAIIAGDVYNFMAGREEQLQQMIAYFPEEEKAIRDYYKLVSKVAGLSLMFFAERTMPDWLSKSVGYFLRRGFYKYSQQTTYEVIRGLTSNEKLISVLSAQCGNYGLPPKKSSFAIHAMVTDHFLDGGNYPVGGSSSIPKSLISVIEANGGTIAISAPVKRIVIENNKATGVEMENGDILRAGKIISNAGIHNTYNKLIRAEKSESTTEINNLKASISHICLYVGLKGTDDELALPKHNIWLYNSYELDKDYNAHLEHRHWEPSLSYISFPSAKDTDWARRHPGTSTVQVIASCPYEWVEEWKDMKWKKRGDEYDKYKAEMQERLLEKLYSVLPQLKGKIEVCELSTPLSTRHFSNYERGEIYGLEHSPKRFTLKQLRATTPYKNLYLTGQDIVCVGVGSAMFSGIITSVVILNRNLLSRISKYKVPE
ncbi:MAG: NAD(P)/FAD-dependent oxidoreductase [Bacteroidetes bacterium]|nr:NAD(P)/FAD-dependent oxidoreductase [Bacteroidota bacterium]